ncbi:MAG TPA: hypothetical protein VFF69_01645 [Phycisphaerales bacterium]|nr:hypothetical protein [Phycisphaerales bacterium]
MGITDSNSDLSPSLAEVTRGSPQMEDELLAERLESAGLAWSRQGRTPTLRELVTCIPILRSRPISLDAAIDVALRGHLAAGLTLEESAEQLRADAPELADAIEAHLALRSMLGSLPAPVPVETEDLPRPFGPALRDGKQRYQLEEALGSGTQGVVFRAMDRLLAADGRPLSEVAEKPVSDWNAFLESVGYEPGAGFSPERNSLRQPWTRRLDFHYEIGLPQMFGTRVSVQADILNLANLFDDEAGVQKFVLNTTYMPVTFTAMDPDTGKPIYRETANDRLKPGNQFSTGNLASRWQGRLGVRVSF